MAGTIFITGSNRGIGFEFVKQFSEEGFKVIASCRDPKNADDLQAMARSNPNIEIIKLDVQSEKEIDELKNKLSNVPIDILINNAGISGDKRIFKIDNISLTDLKDEILNVLSINAISPLLITKTLLPNLMLGKLKTVASISSNLGSISGSREGGSWNIYGYKSSKAALNMLMSCFAVDDQHKQLRVLILHPGWVQTDMGGEGANVKPEESIAGMKKIILTSKVPSGTFLDYQGHLLEF